MGFMDEYYKVLQEEQQKSGSASSGGAGKASGSGFMAEYNKALVSGNGFSISSGFNKDRGFGISSGFNQDRLKTFDAPISERIAARTTVSSKKKKKEEEEERKWFQKGLFEDGYDFGDVTKTILGIDEDTASLKDLTVGSIKRGFYNSRLGEESYKAMMGNANEKEAFQKLLESEEYQFTPGNDFASAISGAFEQGGQLLRQVTNPRTAAFTGGAVGAAIIAGNAGPQALLPEEIISVPAVATAAFKASSAASNFEIEAGHAYNEMIELGVSEETAKKVALVVGGGNAALELWQFDELVDAYKVANKSGATKSTAKMIFDVIKDSGADVLKETAQEDVQELVTIGGVQYASKKDKGEYAYTAEEVKDRLADTTKSSLLTFGAMNAPGVVRNTASIVSDQKQAKSLTENEQKVVDKLYNDEIANREEKLTKKEKSKIYASIVSNMEKGYISIDTIEEVLGGKTYEDFKKVSEWEDSLQEEYNELHKMKRGDMTGEQIDREAELKQHLEEAKANGNRDILKTQLGEEVFGLVKGDRLVESYNERTRRGQKFEADLSQYDAKQQGVIQKAIDSGILNNTNRTHEFVDIISKISADKGVFFDFTNNARLKESGFAIDGKQVNGFVSKDGITLNIDSPKAWQKTVGHEVTHVLEGTELYNELQKTLFDYAESKGELGTRWSSLKELYKDVKDADINAELTADLVGEYLFTDEDFIKNLSVNNKNVFQKIYDEVKYLVKVATGSKEAKELEKVKRAFEAAYKEAGKAQSETKYSITEAFDDVNGTHFNNAVLLDNNFFDGTPPRKWGEKLRKEVEKRAANDPFILPIVDENGDTTLLQFASPQDRVTKDGKSNHKVLDKLSSSSDNISKLAVIHIDEIVSVSEENSPYYTNENNHQWLDQNGWLHRNANVINQKNGNIYNLTVDIAKAADGRTILYATDGKIKKVGNVQVNSLKIKGSGQNSNFKTKVPQNGEKVKLSLSDSDGKRLTAQQQKYFRNSKVRDENGNLKVMYHGTPNGDFTVFKDGTYFTENKEYADRYQNPGASSIGTGKVASNPKTFEVYLDIKKPFDLGDAEARNIYINEYIKGGNAMGINPYLSDAEYAKIQTIDWTEGEDLREFLIENEYDYDGLVLDEGATGGYGEEVQSRGKSYVVFSPEQVKNAGNQNPTSDPDIRYSLSADSDGRTLTKEQEKYFKGSKVTDENGKLKAVYHGSPADFNTFSLEYLGTNGTAEGYGFYFTDKKSIAENYSKSYEVQENGKKGKLFECYLDIKKPLSDTEVTITRAQFKKFLTTLNKQTNSDGEPLDILSNYGDVEWEGLNNVLNSAMEIEYDGNDNDVDLIHSIINGCGNMEVVLDVLRKTIGYDGIIVNEATWGDDQTIYIAFHPEQIKNVDNLTPTKDPDIRKSLSAEGEQFGNSGQFATPANALRFEAPTTEENTVVAENATTPTVSDMETVVTAADMQEMFPDNGDSAQAELEKLYAEKEALERDMLSMVENGGEMDEAWQEKYNRIGEDWHKVDSRIKEIEQAEAERFNGLDDSQVPPEMEAPFYGDSESQTVDNPFEERDWYEVGNQKVKAYMYENPDVKPFFQEEAMALMGELNSTQKGERIYNDQLHYDSGGEKGWMGVKRLTSESIETMLDGWGMSYADIEKGLNAIIEDHGAENIAAAKKIEFMLNDRLLNGYKDFYTNGRIEPNQEYINLLNEKQINSYSKEAFDSFMANADQYAPYVEDMAPVKPLAKATPDTMDAPVFEANGQTTMFEETEKPNRGTRKEYHQSIIDRIKGAFKAGGFDFDNVLKNAKNLSTWSTVDNTPQRVMEKSLGYKEGGILADITVNKVAQNETEGIKWLNAYVDQLKQISKQYGIKPGSKESAAAQMYAEGFYVNDKNEIVRYGDPELIQDFGNSDVRRRIKGLAGDPRIRKIYDDTLANINESRARNLYPEIPRLDNYFLHFRAMEDTFSTLGLPFNPNDIRAKDLPTDLNGVTADLKPGQPYFASAMHREGKRTSFDLLGGVERYLNSAKNQIYHIDDIQTLRALRNYIAETYGQATGLEDIDSMTDAEAEDRINQVFGSHLSTFAKFLNEEANVLAGKTALIDRGVEGIIGRRGITFLNTLNRQVGSNMVGYNVSSSLTNFLPVAQTFAKTNKFDFTKAFAQTVANKLSGGRLDSFAEDSPVVIRRKGEDRFYRTAWQKLSDPGYALMGMVDDISTEIIARTKYNEFTRKGMDSQKAHFETDKWVSRLMGDRSLGQQPQLYNSKMLGLFTKFQLEVRNQLDSQFYDTIQETKVSNEYIQNELARNVKTATKVASVFAQLAVAQHLYGKAFESIAGYNPAFDIIEVLMTTLGLDDEEDEEDTVKDNLEQGFEALMEDLPYASIVTGGGRIPVSSALPIKEFFKGEDQYGNEKSRWEILGEVAPYYLMPGGYGQAKKTIQGLKMFSEDHPIAGSYTDSGNLRFPVEDTTANRIKAGIFGQYASEDARKYFDQEQRTLNPEQTEVFAGLDVPIEEYWEYRDSLNEFYDLKDKTLDAAYADGATDEDVLMGRYIDAINDEIYALYDQQKEIASGNSENKTEELRKLQKKMEQLLSDSKYAEYSTYVSGAYAEVGDRRYNKDADSGKWYEIKPKNADGTDNWYYQKEKEVTKGLGITAEQYWNNREEYNYAYDKPGRYAIAQAVGGYDIYKQHYDVLENWQSDNYLAADKDSDGNSISGSRKDKVIDYINSLDMDYGERIILYRTVYSSKADKKAYNQDIIDYLNERDDISAQEMRTILEELDFKVDSEGYITW